MLRAALRVRVVLITEQPERPGAAEHAADPLLSLGMELGGEIGPLDDGPPGKM